MNVPLLNTRSASEFLVWLDTVLSKCDDQVALQTIGGDSLTYTDLRQLIHRLTKELQAAGIGPTDRVAVLLPAGGELAVISLCLMSVAVCVPCNPDSSDSELKQRLSAVNARWVLCGDELHDAASRVAEAMSLSLIKLARSDNDLSSMRIVSSNPGSASAARHQESKSPHDPVLCLFTSGSTADPKIVPLSAANLQFAARNLATSLALTAADCCLNMLPMYHVGGLIDLLLAPLYSGGRIVISSDMSAASFIAATKNAQPTWFQAVPTMLQNFLTQVSSSNDQPPTFRFIRSVSSALPNRLLHQVEALFRSPVIEMYGMTETTGLICSNPLPPAQRKQGTVGICHGLDIRVVDKKSRAQPVNQVGEVQVRGEGVFAGYETDPPGLYGEFDHEWFRTGDQGYLDDDGYLHLVGRIKEIINRGGEKIAPLELDRVAELHHQVAQAAAFAIPHASLGEDVGMALVLTDEKKFEQAQFMEHMSTELADLKVPKQVYVIDRLPRTRGGKLQRHRILDSIDQNQTLQKSAKTKPGTDLEQQLARLWMEVLNLDSVYLEDNFFQVGGDSLSATVLMLEIKSRLGVEIAMSSLFRAPTIQQLASIILDASSSPTDIQQDILQQVANELSAFMSAWRGDRVVDDGLLVGRNTTGNRQPLFWGVNAHSEFDQLAEVLDPAQPVYGFRSLYKTNFRYNIKPSQLARLYLDEIRSVQPVGPYLLGGFCEAGKVAFELASLLRSRGEEVSSLMLQDQFIARPYDGRVAFFLCAVGANSPYYRFHQPLLGWRKYYSGSMALYRTRIKHKYIYDQRLVPLLAKQISHEIRMANNNPPETEDFQNNLQVLPAEAYQVSLSTGVIPAHVLPLSQIDLQVSVTNNGPVTWLETRRSGVQLAARWRNRRGVVKKWIAGLGILDSALEPGQSREVNIRVKVPSRPGKYDLELDMMDDGVTWFNKRWETPVSSPVAVTLWPF